MLAGCAGETGENGSNGDEGSPESQGSITLAVFNGWDEGIATSELWKAVLEDEGYDVTLEYADVAPLFAGLSTGDYDFTTDVWLPGTHAVVDDSLGEDTQCFIRFRLCFPVGRRGVQLPSVDHFILRNGRALSRRAHFDPAPLMLAVALRPWMWWGFLRYRFTP